MESLIASPKKFNRKIITKARAALAEGFRRPINATHRHWKQISVDYRHRILLRGDGNAILMTHETMNSFMHRRGHTTRD